MFCQGSSGVLGSRNGQDKIPEFSAAEHDSASKSISGEDPSTKRPGLHHDQDPQQDTTHSPLPPSNDLDDLFASLDLAWFSASVPGHITRMWQDHGGIILPISADIVRAHDNGYLNIRREAIDQLNQTLRYARYSFVVTDDPILHFIRPPRAAFYHAEWVCQCLREGRLLDLEEFAVLLPETAYCDMARVENMLRVLVDAQPDTVTAPPIDTNTNIEQDNFSLQMQVPTQQPDEPPRYILQPEMVLDLPDLVLIDTLWTISRPPADSNSPPMVQLPLYNVPTPPPPTYRPLTFFETPSPTGSLSSSKPKTHDLPFDLSLPDTQKPDIPSIPLMLDIDFSPDFKLDALSPDELRQLMQEAVSDANRKLAGELQSWSAGTSGKMVPFSARGDQTQVGRRERGNSDAFEKMEQPYPEEVDDDDWMEYGGDTYQCSIGGSKSRGVHIGEETYKSVLPLRQDRKMDNELWNEEAILPQAINRKRSGIDTNEVRYDFGGPRKKALWVPYQPGGIAKRQTYPIRVGRTPRFEQGLVSTALSPNSMACHDGLTSSESICAAPPLVVKDPNQAVSHTHRVAKRKSEEGMDTAGQTPTIGIIDNTGELRMGGSRRMKKRAETGVYTHTRKKAKLREERERGRMSRDMQGKIGTEHEEGTGWKMSKRGTDQAVDKQRSGGKLSKRKSKHKAEATEGAQIASTSTSAWVSALKAKATPMVSSVRPGTAPTDSTNICTPHQPAIHTATESSTTPLAFGVDHRMNKRFKAGRGHL